VVTVFIYLPGQIRSLAAGQYQYDAQNRVGHFTYFQDYLELPDALPVDPITLPLGTTRQSTVFNEGLHGAFRDSVPDLWGRLVLENLQGLPVGSVDAERLLLLSDASRAGNLDFRESRTQGEKPFGPPAVEDFDDLIEAAATIENNATLTPHMRMLMGHGDSNFSMGGARPKCLVENADGLWLAKLPSKHDTWNNARVELATMRLAESCGIRVPEMRLAQTGRSDILMLKRFDREKTVAGYARLGYLSALSVMGLDESDRSRHSYLEFADRVRSFFPQSWTRDKGEELFRRILFNIFARNTDDHARNHGILLCGTNMELSPAFDITPTVATPGITTEFNLAMAPGPLGRVASIENALAGAAHFGLNAEQAAATVHDVGEKVGLWRQYFEEAGVSEEDMEKFGATFDSSQREKALQVSVISDDDDTGPSY
jgi:serine/threonine-protein kinase HipA